MIRKKIIKNRVLKNALVSQATYDKVQDFFIFVCMYVYYMLSLKTICYFSLSLFGFSPCCVNRKDRRVHFTQYALSTN